MNRNKKSRLTVIGLSILVGTVSIATYQKPAQDYSLWERRKLTSFPEISWHSIENGTYMNQMECATADQFPLRDQFRRLKSQFSYYVLSQNDIHNIVLEDNSAVALTDPININSVMHASNVLTNTYEQYLESYTSNVYYCIIPDKAYYLNDQSNYPRMDYDNLFALMNKQMTFAKEISISDLLSLDDYYRTDSHWKQTSIEDVAKRISEYMGIHLLSNESPSYIKNTATIDFKGVYYGQTALDLHSDCIYYFSNEVLDASKVYHYETNTTTSIYDYHKLNGKDPYDFFLSGAEPILKVTNSAISTPRKLILFRDSFGSSIAPLLLGNYSEILLIDLRYINSSYLSSYIDFRDYQDSDVLFLYSTSLLNSSSTLR